MKDEDQLICHYCELPIKEGTETKDHVYPKAKIKKHREKGEEIPIDIHDNKVIACEECNQIKGAKDYNSFKNLGLKAIRHLKKMLINKKISKKYKKPYKRKRR